MIEKKEVIEFFDRLASDWDAGLIRNEEIINTILDNAGVTAGKDVLDVACGTGVLIPDYLKRKVRSVTGIDISPQAIEVAKENAKRNGVEVEFKIADIFDSNEENLPYLQIVPQGKESSIFNLQYDIVVSNPPYICESEKSSMRRNVLEYEPATALFVPDSDPLRFYRRIAELKLGAYLFFEINEAYPAELSAMLDQLGYTDIRLTNDIYGKPRIIEARMVR